MINNNYIVFTCFYPHQTPKKMMLTNPESGHLSYCSRDHCGTAGECAKCSWIVPKTSAGLDSPSYSRWMYTNAWLTSWQIRPLWREMIQLDTVKAAYVANFTQFSETWPVLTYGHVTLKAKTLHPSGGFYSHFYCKRPISGPTSTNPSKNGDAHLRSLQCRFPTQKGGFSKF